MTATTVTAEKKFLAGTKARMSEIDWTRVAVKTFWFSLATFWVAEAALFFSVLSWVSLFGLIYLGIAGSCVVFGLAA